MTENANTPDLQSLVAEIVSGYVRNNHVAPADLSVVINTVYRSLSALGKPAAPIPAVPISQSATRKHVVCLDCGWRGQTLKGHLRSRHGVNKNEYRARWGLPSIHRLTATAYSEERSARAKQRGLGRSKTDVLHEGAEAIQQLIEVPDVEPENHSVYEGIK